MTGPDPAVAAVRSAVRAAVDDVPRGGCVVVACSGGADSLALAAGTAFVAPRLGLSARAVVVDHGLGAGSADVAQAAAAACDSLGLDTEVVRVAVVNEGQGPEAAARDARHDALTRSADRLGAAAVLLGHTRDDQAEQVLLGLARGSGARSLAGMPARRAPFRRPLLCLPRTTTERVCAVLGLSPWSDPDNADPAFARSRARTRVLPVLERELGPGVAAALVRTADSLRDDADALEALAVTLLESAGDPLEVGLLAAAPRAVRHRALRAAAVAAGSPAGAVTRDRVLQCDALVTDWHGQGPVHLPGGVLATRACGRLTIAVSADATARTAPT